MGNLIERLGAFRNKAVEHVITNDDGEELTLKFYPPRMRMLISGNMRSIIEPITQSISTLFEPTNQDASRQQTVEKDGTVETFVQGLNPEIVKVRSEKREAAIAKALGVLLEDDTRYQIGMLLADSLRDDFPQNEAERAKAARQFMDEVTTVDLVSMVIGYLKALAPVLNKEGKSIFSDLQGKVMSMVERHLAGTQVGARVEGRDGEESLLNIDEGQETEPDNVHPMPTSPNDEQS